MDPKQLAATINRVDIEGNTVSPTLRRLAQNTDRDGRKLARESGGEAGMGGWKKRRPDCNDLDRDSEFVL